MFEILLAVAGVVGILFLFVLFMSCTYIGPTEIGLVLKRVGKKLEGDNPVAFNGEAGYQAELLSNGLRFRLWPFYSIKKFPQVQIPAGQIGVVIAQVGKDKPIGAKSATYKPEFGNFSNLAAFVRNGGEKGVQRPVLTPGTNAPIHPIAFIVLTKDRTYGMSVSASTAELTKQIDPKDLTVRVIAPEKDGTDQCGIVTALEGPSVESGDIASRLGGFDDMKQLITSNATDAQLVESLLDTKNALHSSYQDYQAFLDNGGKIGVQHDPLLYGSYTLNPYLVRLDIVPMLVIEQGEVAVIKSYIGLPTADTSGPTFKHGSIVRPGHRGLWQEPLRTGKYALNPHVYKHVLVPTKILTLNWAEYSSAAHTLDKELKSIDAKSKEGFEFSIDLQVQLHIPDTMAPRVISRVGTMQNLVNELLQGAVGNHFRNKLQGMTAVKFIEERQSVQTEAEAHVRHLLEAYEVETVGVYIQDVKLPSELVSVLKEREIANQTVETLKKKREAEEQRKEFETAAGRANMQAKLVQAELGVDIQKHNADARMKEADGEAYYKRELGKASGEALAAEGEGRAKGYKAQCEAIGVDNTAKVNMVREAMTGNKAIVSQISAGTNGGLVDGLLGLTLVDKLGVKEETKEQPEAPKA